jgi:DNA replication protein DnaC
MSKHERPERPPTPEELQDRIQRHLDVLGLNHVRLHLDDYLSWALKEKPSPSALLDRVLGEEAARKVELRIERRICMSGLKERKSLEAFDWDAQPGIDRAQIIELALLDFVRRSEDLVVTGKAGTGKSHILKSLTMRACQQQIRTRYARCVDLIDDLYAGLADGTYQEKLNRWCNPAFVVVDDVGLGQLKKRDDEPTAAHMLYNLIDRRHGKGSTAISSNIRLGQWGTYLGDATLTVAILDRLAMRATRIDIDGPSYRVMKGRELAKERGTKPPDDGDAGGGGNSADAAPHASQPEAP